MSETPTTPADEPQAEPEPQPDPQEAPADDPAGDDSSDEPQVGRRPDFVGEEAEGSEEASAEE